MRSGLLMLKNHLLNLDMCRCAVGRHHPVADQYGISGRICLVTLTVDRTPMLAEVSAESVDLMPV